MARFWFQGPEPRTRTGGSAVLKQKNRPAPRFYAVLSRFEPRGTAIALILQVFLFRMDKLMTNLNFSLLLNTVLVNTWLRVAIEHFSS